MVSIRKNFFLFLLLIFLTSCSPQPKIEVPDAYKPGQKTFHKICSNCHGSDARGHYTQAPSLIDTDYLPEIFSDDEIRETVIHGTDKMPSQRNKVSDEEIGEIIRYLRHSQKAAGLVIEDEPEPEEDMFFVEEEPKTAG